MNIASVSFTACTGFGAVWFDFDEGVPEDGGEEGVDDPLLDGLPDELPRPPESAEDDEEGVVDGSLDDLVREIGTDA